MANLVCRAADGTRLATDVFRPGGDRRVPAVLLRTPYGRGSHADEGLGWAQHGFAFIAQDTRGRGDSEGTFVPYAHEAADGLAALEWARAQPWCTGDVFIVGGSYSAFCGWAVAVARPAGLRGLVSIVPAMGTHRTAFTETGILNLGDHVWWWCSFAEGRGERKRLVDLMLAHDASLLMHLPVIDLPSRLWVRLEHWSEVVERGPSWSPEWAISQAQVARVTVPVLHIGGWHDPFIRETLAQATVAGSAVRPRPRQDLVVGPWTHTLDFNTSDVGERNYGPDAALPLGQLMVDWMRGVLAGESKGNARMFICGANCWRDDIWPPRGDDLLLYPSDGGRLSFSPPASDGRGSFVDDPARPFPSCSLPLDVTATLGRPDALRFITEPFERPLGWAGTPVVVLTGATDALSCDWVARLLELLPDGRAVYISHGIAAADAGEGVPHRVRIALTPIAITLSPGSRLCLELSGSYFPEHARNLHDSDRYRGTSPRPARQEVYLDGSTFLLLPGIPT